MVPKTDVDSDILANRTNRARATAATGCGTPLEAPGDKIFLYDVIGEPQRVAEVRVTPRAQQLIRAHRHMARGLGIPHVKCCDGKLPTFRIAQGSRGHLPDHPRNVLKSPGDLQRAVDDVMNHVAPMRHVQEPEIADLRAQAVRAERSK